MKHKIKHFAVPNLRMSGTSFILHAGYIDGVRYAAERCDDVALLLLSVGKNGEWLISEQEIEEIGHILDGEGATAHVHLPTDMHCNTEADSLLLYDATLRAIDRAAPLNPHTFVLHVDVPSLRNTNTAPSLKQQDYIEKMLQRIISALGDPSVLAIENLEQFPATFWDAWVEQSGCSRCLDIGHLWKQCCDPAPVLAAWLPQTRIVHLHGLKPACTKQNNTSQCEPVLFTPQTVQQLFGKTPKDHQSLQYIPDTWVDAVMHLLWRNDFAGVLNLELFDVLDVEISHHTLIRSWERWVSRCSG